MYVRERSVSINEFILPLLLNSLQIRFSTSHSKQDTNRKGLTSTAVTEGYYGSAWWLMYVWGMWSMSSLAVGAASSFLFPLRHGGREDDVDSDSEMLCMHGLCTSFGCY